MSKASSNRKCVTVQNASTSSGANVFQYQYNGSGNMIDVYEGEKGYFLGSWMGSHIFSITDNDTIICIENYDELMPEIEQLRKDTKSHGKIVDLP